MPTLVSAYGHSLTFEPHPSDGEALLYKEDDKPSRVIRAEYLAAALNGIIPGFTAAYTKPARALSDLSKDDLIDLMHNEYGSGVSYWNRSTDQLTNAGERYLAARRED